MQRAAAAEKNPGKIGFAKKKRSPPPMERPAPENRPDGAARRNNGGPAPRTVLSRKSRVDMSTPIPGNFECLADIFRGRECIIVGGGGSLYGFKFERLQETGAAVIAISNSIMDVPFADLAFSCDKSTMVSAGWSEALQKGVKDWLAPPFRLVCCWDGMRAAGNITVCKRTKSFHDKPSAEIYAPHSGAGALSLAIWGTAKKIYLMGADSVRFNSLHLDKWLECVRGSDWYDQAKVDEAEDYLRNNKANHIVHYFSLERGHKRDKSKAAYVNFHKSYAQFGAYADHIVNCSPISAIPYFGFEGLK